MHSTDSLLPRCGRFVLAIVLFLELATGLAAQAVNGAAQAFTPGPTQVDPAYLREHYTKYEYKIPMRDGMKLFAAGCAPKDEAQPHEHCRVRSD